MANEQKHYRMLRKLRKLRGVRQPFAWFVLTCYEEFISKNPNDAINLETLIEHCNDRWKELTDQEKTGFNDLAREDEERYNRDCAELLEYFQDELKERMKEKGGKKELNVSRISPSDKEDLNEDNQDLEAVEEKPQPSTSE
uniref:HMG box domain-containing protein n=1 Tax=Acrobeloides nanus TaxID=290746 RepID=A0A914E465_9BILA